MRNKNEFFSMSRKSELLKILYNDHRPAANQTKFHTHNATSIWFTDAEFHRSALFCFKRLP